MVDPNSSIYTRDISPLILAAHKNNYEILKLLLDRGAAIPLPHDARCGCSDCGREVAEDDLRHSRSRINAYRALCSPSLIALSSRDPILTAFQLSWELRRLAVVETEFAVEYKQLRQDVMSFAVSLLDHVRTNQELRIISDYDHLTTAAPMMVASESSVVRSERPIGRLARIRLAMEFKQKRFIAHPSIQQVHVLRLLCVSFSAPE